MKGQSQGNDLNTPIASDAILKDEEATLVARDFERRRFTWRTVVYGFLKSRRRTLRRGSEADGVFLDVNHPWIFFLAVGTMFLSSVDAFMTLRLLDQGMIEANPVMAWLLDFGPAAFAGAKMLMTAFGILTLAFLARARFMNRMRVGIFLTIMFSGYLCLVCYQIVNLLGFF